MTVLFGVGLSKEEKDDVCVKRFVKNIYRVQKLNIAGRHVAILRHGVNIFNML